MLPAPHGNENSDSHTSLKTDSADELAISVPSDPTMSAVMALQLVTAQALEAKSWA